MFNWRRILVTGVFVALGYFAEMMSFSVWSIFSLWVYFSVVMSFWLHSVRRECMITPDTDKVSRAWAYRQKQQNAKYDKSGKADL